MRIINPNRIGWDRVKRVCALGAGGAFITLSAFTLLNLVQVAFNLALLVRTLWNLLFGALMLLLQFGWFEASISTYFGFLDGWFGRGMFYMFVGNNGLLEQSDAGGVLVVISYVVWGACWFVGLLELFGPRSHEAAKSGDSSSTHYRTDASSLAAPLSPNPDGGVTVRVTGQQVNQAAQFASDNSSSIWSAAVAGAGGTSQYSGSAQQPASDNPFATR
jgi:hypothetical protein